MKCSKVLSSMEAYLGGTISLRQKRSIDKHLGSCEKCRAELERCTKENSLYRQVLAPESLSGALRNYVLKRLDRSYKPAVKLGTERRRSAFWIASVAAAAQFIVAFWLAGTFLFPEVPVKAESVRSKGPGKMVVVRWKRDLDPYRYFSLDGKVQTGAPDVAEGDKNANQAY